MAFATKVKALFLSFVLFRRLVFFLSARWWKTKDMSFIFILNVLTMTGLRSLAFRSAYNKNRLARSSLVFRERHKTSNTSGRSFSECLVSGRQTLRGSLSYSVCIETPTIYYATRSDHVAL